jgi:TPR repeat protein
MTKQVPNVSATAKAGIDGRSDVLDSEYESALASQDANTVFALARRYEEGEPGKPVFAKALALYEHAARLGHLDAAFCAGYLYSDGKHEAVDFVQARHFYEMAVAGGHAGSMCNLGLLYRQGQGGAVDPAKAKELYEKAIAKGSREAAYNLAYMYCRGVFGSPDFEQAKTCCEMAATLGSAAAMNMLGVLHEEKRIAGADLEVAVSWYIRAVDGRNMDAAMNLARLYQARKFAEGTRERIQELFRLADSWGHPNAYTYLTNPMIKAVLDRLNGVGTKRALLAQIEQALDALEETFFAIRKKHLISGSKKLAHFTTWPAIESIMTLDSAKPARNCLRLYHVEYMNDPSEGQRLLSFKGNGKARKSAKAAVTSKQLKELFEGYYFSSFEKHNSTKSLLPSVFTVSLTQEADRLDLWRAYGRDGAGYCLVLPVEQEAGESAYVRNRSASLGFLSTAIDSDDDRQEKKQDIPCLYWIQYSDKEVIEALDAIATPLDTVLSLKGKMPDSAWKQVASCATAILIELLYLYKDEQYSTEKEARALSVMRLDHPRVQPDERTPGRLYCETAPFLFNTPGSEVILGPKVQDATAAIWNIRYRLTKMGIDGNTVVRKSSVPYR